jgi:formylglycine-generating enzyme
MRGVRAGLGKAFGGALAFVFLAAMGVAHWESPPEEREAELAGMIASVGLAHPPMQHEWQQREGKYWQIVSPGSEDAEVADAAEGAPGACRPDADVTDAAEGAPGACRPDADVTDAAEGAPGACRPGMVEIRGRMKTEDPAKHEPVEELQKSMCTDWISREYPERCARYDRDRWIALSAGLPSVPLHYCIDRYEYPNQRGAYPWIVVTFGEAQSLCAREDKRLCTEEEWTFACEGEQARPFPNGYVRDPGACVIDRPYRPVEMSLFDVRSGARFVAEIDRLWQGEPSGSHPLCRSPFGVDDTIGNVDEWTTSVIPGERPSILNGGYWGPVRTTCRATTRAHGDGFFFYQIGFRCCANAPAVSFSSASSSGGP